MDFDQLEAFVREYFPEELPDIQLYRKLHELSEQYAVDPESVPIEWRQRVIKHIKAGEFLRKLSEPRHVIMKPKDDEAFRLFADDSP